MKRKILTLIASIVLLFAFSVTVYAAVIAETIKETHKLSLSPDMMKVSLTGNSNSYNDSVLVTNGSIVHVDNYEKGYDLVALSSDQTDGFLIDSELYDENYEISSTRFLAGKTYYAVAVMHHSYNRYVSTFMELEVLNNEFRHNVVNDDLKIGNVTDLYDSIGNYIGNNKSYDLNDNVYDFYKNEVLSVIDTKTLSQTGPISYEVSSITSSTVVNMNNIRRNDIYHANGTRYDGVVTLADYIEIKDNEFYNAYGKKLNQLYYLEPVTDSGSNVISYKETNYFFGKDEHDNNILIINGILFDNTQLDLTDSIQIDLSKCYYEDGILVDNAYVSKVFKNIYLLNNIETNKDLTLIMPCNINLLNNNIVLNNDININHYYNENYIISNLTIAGNTGALVDNTGASITSSSEHKLTFASPNATLTKPNDIYVNIVTGKDNLLSDVKEFVKGFFFNDALIDEGTKYSIVYSNPILPKDFYDEDIVITYKYEDDSEFVVERTNANQKKKVKIYINGVETDEVIDLLVVGTSDEAITKTVAKAIEYEINNGFNTSTTSRQYVNFDKALTMIRNKTLSFEEVSGISVSEVYLEVNQPKANNASFNLYTRSGAGTTDSPYVYTKVNSSDPISALTTYYEKYLLFERANYTFASNAYGKLIVKIDNGGTVKQEEISVALSPVSKSDYIEFLKQEIGQIYFEDSDTYKLKTPEELVKYDVKSITYTAKLKEGTEYLETEALPIENYEISNLGMANGASYYVLVEVELNSGDEKTISFYTDKVVANASTSGGEGENDYQSSLFEKEFSDMSIFIGLSNDFELENDLHYYLKIVDPNEGDYSDFVRLYRKITPTSVTYAKGLIDGVRKYYYLNEDLTLREITSASEVVDLSALYTLPLDTDNIQTDEVNNVKYSMVFLTNSDNIPGTSTTLTVKAYISDNDTLLTGEDLIAKATKINLYNGLFDYNRNPITELTNGKEKYIITYNSSKEVTNVEYIDSMGITSTISNTDLLDISGYYCNGFIYDLISTGEKIYIKNGIYSNKTLSDATAITTYNHGLLTFNLDYSLDPNTQTGYVSSVYVDLSSNTTFHDKSGTLLTSSNYDLSQGLYDSEGEPLKNIMISNASFTLNYDSLKNCTGYVIHYVTADSTISGNYYRIPSQQTTFYKNTEDHEIITIYVQSYSFTVPGVYRAADFNAKINSEKYAVAVDLTGDELIASNPDVFDMYKALMDIYGQFNGSDEARGYKEINGSKYFLLVSDLYDAKTIAAYNTDSTFILENGSFTNLDCGNKSVNLVNVISKLPNIKNIYLKNANFARHTHITSISENGVYQVSKIVELSLDNIRGENSTVTGFQSDINFKRYTNLQKLVITNSLLTTVGSIYRKVKYLDLSNNNLTDIDFIVDGVILEYVNLTDNNISKFETLKDLTTLKYLYVSNNNIATSVKLNSDTIYPYGTPRIESNILYGQINIPVLIDVYERNANIIETDFNYFLFNELNSGNINYLYSAYTANAISYLTKYNYGLELDLSLVERAGYETNVYVSKDGTNFINLSNGASTQFSLDSGYYVTTDTDYIYAIVSITKGSYTVYRELYFVTS